MLFKQGVNSPHHVHQNNVENREHFKWVPNHLGVQVRIIIKHVACIDIERLAFDFNDPFDRNLILPFPEQTIFRLRHRGTVPEMLQKPINRLVHILHAYIRPPNERRPSIVGVVALTALGGGRRVVSGSGSGGGINRSS